MQSLGPGQLATFLLEGVLQGVGAQGYNFLSDLVFSSDGTAAAATTAQLDAMQSQLDQITTRLDAIDDGLKSLSGQVAGDALTMKQGDLDKWHNSSLSVYKEQFLPIATRAEALSKAKQVLDDAQNASCGPTAHEHLHGYEHGHGQSSVLDVRHGAARRARRVRQRPQGPRRREG